MFVVILNPRKLSDLKGNFVGKKTKTFKLMKITESTVINGTNEVLVNGICMLRTDGGV